MHSVYKYVLGFVFCCLFVSSAMAGQVTVVKVLDPARPVSQQALRKQAMDIGFARAVVSEMQALSNAQLSEERVDALEEYFLDKAPRYILGYKVISATMGPLDPTVVAKDNPDQKVVAGDFVGVTLTMDVRLNRPVLRDRAVALGLAATAKSLQPFSMHFSGGELIQDDLDELQRLMLITGVVREQGAMPILNIGRLESGIWQASLDSGTKVWNTQFPKLDGLWLPLWEKFFKQKGTAEVAKKGIVLRVSGWFTPDGVNDFDQELRSWTDAASRIELEKVDMNPTRITGVWRVEPLNEDSFKALLEEYAPVRGLDYSFE